MVYILIFTIISMLIAFSIVIHRMQKEIELANKIRQGYERKYNTFRIKYTVLSKLQAPENIITKARQISKPLYIYGGGVIGERFLEILSKDKHIEILRMIESNELRSTPEIGKNLRQDALVVVTPMFDYENIVSLLKETGVQVENIVGIDEFI